MDYYFLNGLAPATRRSYESGKRRFLSFCEKVQAKPLPVLEELLGQFISQLANENISHSTIKCYLAAVRHLQIATGLGDPRISRMARLEQVLRGIKMVQSQRSQYHQGRLPITPELLRKMKLSWGTGNWDHIMLWASATLCFFGFFRSGEITVPSQSSFDRDVHLSFGDVSVDNQESPRQLRVHLKASKTDPFRAGVDVFVGATGNDLCPVSAVLSFLVVRGAAPGPLFKFQDGTPLTRARLVVEVQKALEAAGVDHRRYTGHSFRSGAATTAARRGIEETTIKMLGRWKSNAFQLYIKTPRNQLAAYSHRLAQPPQARC